jgi:hypothetical protein
VLYPRHTSSLQYHLLLGSQAATPITTTAQNLPVPPGASATAAIDPPQLNPALPQFSHPLPIADLVLSPAAETFPRKLVDKVKSAPLANIPIPHKVGPFLNRHPDQALASYIHMGLLRGFRIGYRHNRANLRSRTTNHPSSAWKQENG